MVDLIEQPISGGAEKVVVDLSPSPPRETSPEPFVVNPDALKAPLPESSDEETDSDVDYEEELFQEEEEAVSYTHLTLPTILLV